MIKISKKLYIIITLVVITLVSYFWIASKGKTKNAAASVKQPTKVDTFIVKPSLLINEISVSGSLLPFEVVDLKNEIPGRVTAINLPEGKSVKKGTLLVKLYDEDLQANLNKLQIQLAIQEKIYKRQSELLKANGISQNDYDQSGLQLNSIRADIAVQNVMIRKTEVLAPFDGVIGLRNISVGAEIVPSTLLATIRSEDQLKLDFSVPEKYSPAIKSGMKISFTTASNNEKIYDATVMATEHGIETLTRNLKVRAIVDNKYEHLISGAFARVNLQLNENKNALLIPTQAIIPNDQNKSVIIAKGGKAHFVLVKTGIRRAYNIEITEGIKAGDTIITTGILFLKEGSKLDYASIKSDPL